MDQTQSPQEKVAELYPQVKTIGGTEPGSVYYVFARIGDYVLSVKPNAVAAGKQFGVEDTTYIGARLRAALVPGLFSNEDNNIVAFGTKTSKTPGQVWKNILWDNDSPNRSSSQFGTFLKGTPEKAPEVLALSFSNNKMANDMADYLIKMAGPENLVLTKAELAGLLTELYMPTIKFIYAKVEHQKAFVKLINESIGSFDMQSTQMAKIKEKAGDLPHYEGLLGQKQEKKRPPKGNEMPAHNTDEPVEDLPDEE